MIPSVSHNLSLDDFLSQYGDNSRYELIDGELIDMEPTGRHEQVAAFIGRKLNATIDRLDLPYFLPHRCLVRPLASVSAFRPDVIVLDETQLDGEPLWTREPVITNGATVKLVVEVVSTNWQNDYARKYEDYEALGIPEYWIIDYLGIGGHRYIGKPKQPTVTIAHLVDGEYRSTLLRSGEVITCDVIPEVEVSVDRLFAFGDNAAS